MSDQFVTSINPATLEPLGNVPITSAAKVKELATKARAAQIVWSRLSFQERGRYLLKAREYLLDHIDDLAFAITQENGKPLVEAITAELYPVADLLYYFATNTERMLKSHSVGTGIMGWLGRRSRISYQPAGVVGIISPWNYPFSIPAGTVAMALAAGNAVLLKPSSVTSLIGLKIAQMLGGLPEFVFNHIPGDSSTGEALCNSSIDKMIFTGSVGVGKKVMVLCSERLIPCALELGGKDPMIVRSDADIDLASSGAVWGAFTNAGQCCASVERVYVHETIAGKFIAAVVEKTSRLRQGMGTDVNVDVGPLTTEAQLRTVEQQVDEARQRGAKILTGGERNAAFPGYFYKPTVITGVDHSFSVMTEETFGPVMPIMTFSDDRQAIQLANDTKFGLTASIWTRDRAAANAMAREIRAGTVTINDCLYTHAICQTPWGGRGHSGYGRTHGRPGLMELVDLQHVQVNTITRYKDLWWYPYGQKVYDLFKLLSRKVTGSAFFKFVNLPKILKATRLPKV